jgi:hypothetical protein
MAGAGIHPYHQQWPPAAAPPPAPGVVPPPPPVPDAAADEVRTIFITGLPADVKERELHNLLRWLPGFEASQINFKGDQPMGFALFSSAQHAVAAKAALQVRFFYSFLHRWLSRVWMDLIYFRHPQDLVFDADTKAALHTEMAKKNLFVKRGAIFLFFCFALVFYLLYHKVAEV